MRLILVRHGETAHNAGGMVQGRADVPLNDRGRRQARALAGALRTEPVCAVYASPLQRARDTATAIAETHGLTVVTEPDLAEMDIGEMEGLSGAEMRARYADFLRVWAGPEGPLLRMPGGESLTQVQERAWAVIERLRAAHEEDTIVVASHNFVIGAVMCRAVNVPLYSFRRMRHGVASRSVIDFRPDRILVLKVNDTCHLDEDGLRSDGPWEAR